MAGDWIKMRADLQTHPKVVRIVSALKADKLRVIGGLHAVWCLFDTHSEDGTLDGYTFEAIDNEIRWPGFSAAMSSVDWLSTDGDSSLLPEFDEHNGQSAKRRAQETKRKRDERRAAENGDADRKVSASDADEKRSREEKRREDSSSPSLRSGEEGARPTPGEACKAMKAAGMGSVSPSNQKLIALLDAGITIPELVDAASYAVEHGRPFAYALATAEGRRRDAASTKPLPAAQRGAQTTHDRRAATLAGLTDTGEHHADRDCRTVDVEAHIVA